MSLNAPPQALAVQVVAAVIERDGALLICQRPLDKHHGGLWEFPGGKISPGESPAEALVRELHEELGLEQVSPGLLLYRDEAAHSGQHVDIDFIAVQIRSEPRCLEHADMRWVCAEDALSLPMAPADRRLLEHLLRQRDALSEKSIRSERAASAMTQSR